MQGWTPLHCATPGCSPVPRSDATDDMVHECKSRDALIALYDVSAFFVLAMIDRSLLLAQQALFSFLWVCGTNFAACMIQYCKLVPELHRSMMGLQWAWRQGSITMRIEA